MKSSKPPVLPNHLETLVLTGVQDGQRIEEIRLEANLSGAEARGLSLATFVAENAEISAGRFKKADFSDGRLENCLLFGTNFDGAGWRRIGAAGGMWSGVILSDSILEDVTFKGVKLNLANFRVSRLRRVAFINCDLSETDFQGAQLQEVMFKGCDLRGSDFRGAKLQDVDLRGSEIADTKNVAGLAGAKVTPAQMIGLAGRMAAEIGLVVED